MIISKQISIMFDKSNVYVNAVGMPKGTGLSWINIPFPVKSCVIREFNSSFTHDSNILALINNDIFGADSCLCLGYIGMDDSYVISRATTKLNQFKWDNPVIFNGIYQFYLRDSDLKQVDSALTITGSIQLVIEFSSH